MYLLSKFLEGGGVNVTKRSVPQAQEEEGYPGCDDHYFHGGAEAKTDNSLRL